MLDKRNHRNNREYADDNTLSHLDKMPANTVSYGALTGLIPGPVMGEPDYELKSYRELYGFGEGLEK